MTMKKASKNALEKLCTVKPAQAVTSIKQSPVLRGHLFLSCDRKFHMN
jgi:hypothetical protein